jgi:CRP-like cAMP-binding protein
VEEEYGVAVTTLGAGQFFGERAILQDTVRNATVISAGRQGTMVSFLGDAKGSLGDDKKLAG